MNGLSTHPAYLTANAGQEIWECQQLTEVFHCRMIIDDMDYGVQAFILQVRDMTTHKALPGIEIGDIGPKYGFNAKDNGYLKFTNIRIPRANLLMKYVKVDKEG